MAKSPLQAANAFRWAACHGSVLLQAMYPSPPGERSESAEEGKTFHALGARILRSMSARDEPLPYEHDIVGTITDNGVMIDTEMYHCARDYATDVFKYCNQYGLLRSINVEGRVELGHIYPGMYGFPDCWIFNADIGELVVWEAKYGHQFVPAFENWQLIEYASGILAQLGVPDEYVTLRLKVYQPRSHHRDGPAREWVIEGSTLRGYVNQLSLAAHEALGANPKCVPGPHCHGCSTHACEALTQTGYAVMDHFSTAMSGSLLTGNNLGLEYRLLERAQDMLKARMTGIKEQVTAELRNGSIIPAITLQPTRADLKWIKPVEEVTMLGDMMGVDLRKPQELITPTQATKLGIDTVVISEYAKRTSSGVKLVIDDGTKARQAFRK